jgi:hypothetical protein
MYSVREKGFIQETDLIELQRLYTRKTLVNVENSVHKFRFL